MKKTLVVILSLMLPLVWVWAAGEDVKPEIDNEGVMITPVKEVNLLDSTNPIPDPPVIATNLFTQDFEEAWDPGTPPTGWTIIDNGSEGRQSWYNQDWYKYYYTASGFADTVARVYYSPNMEEEYDEWLITPDVVLPGAATACSLTFKTFYDDGGTSANYDTAFIKISTDGGSNWTILDTWGSNQGSGTSPLYANYDVTSYAGETVRFGFHLETFGYVGYLGIDYWYMDKVSVWSDASSLLFEDFNNWGTFGDNPPTGWSIIDDGTPKPGQGAWNNNDWYKYTYWTTGAARVYYTSSYYEFMDEWMISPTFAITAGNACTLSFAQYYYHYTNTIHDGDHGYIKVSTDGGSTWPHTIVDLTTTTGSSTKTFFQYSLDAFAGESNLKIAFNFVNNPTGSDYWYIDDVSVDEYVPPTEDIEVTSIDAPNTLSLSGSNYTITATLTQLMADSTLIDSIEFKVEDSTPAVVFADTAYPGVYLHGFESLQFSSATQWNAAVDDWYTITVTMYAATDGNPLNDAYAKTCVVQSLLAYPFYEDFEGGLVASIYDWVGFGTGFGYTTSNYHSPDTALWFSYSGYPNERIVVSPPIAVSGSSVPLLGFWEKESYSGGPGGDETHTVGLVAGDWDLGNLDTLFFEDTSSTLINVYRESVVSAGTIENDTVRIVIWYHNSNISAWNWYVDDVGLYNTPRDDIRAVSMDEPARTLFTGETFSPKGTFENVGLDGQTFDAIMTIEDTSTVEAVIYADTISVTLASGVSQQEVFAGWTVPAGDAETYTFTMTADNPGDEDLSDNEITDDFDAYTHYSEGGPDTYGYEWFDNLSLDPLAPTYSWIELSTSPTADTAGTSSGNLGEFPIGFNFTFYSASFDSVYINGYGYISFGAMYSSGLNDCPMPNSSTPNEPFIAGFWDYGYPYSTYDGATIYETFGTEPDRYMVIQYHNHRYSSYYDDMDFEIILHENGDVVMQYKHVGSPETSGNYGYGKYETVGIEEYTNYNSGLSYICNDDLVGNRLFDSLAILWHYEAPSIDAVMYSIDEPLDGVLIFNGTTVTPQITFGNESDAAYDIASEFLIIDTGTGDTVYSDYDTSLAVPAFDTVQVSFDTWNADPDGEYDAVATVTLAGDGNPANDSKTNTFDVATHYSTGGPDDFGYRWIDNQGSGDEDPPVFAYVDISATGDSLNQGDSGYEGPFALGFTFTYYGVAYDSFWVSNDGLISFSAGYSSLSNDCPLPDPGTPNVPIIAVYWDDMYTRPADSAYVLGQYFDDTIDYYVVQYHNVVNYGQYGDPMDCEIILYEDGDILFQYDHVNDLLDGHGEGATIGLEDDAIPAGLTYQCNASTNPGNLLVDDLAIKFYIPVYAHDIVADEFIVPATGSGVVNVPFDPEVLFTNNGTSDETNVRVRVIIDPGGYNNDQMIAVLDSGTSYSQTFAQFNPTSSGVYTLTAISELVGDEDPASDTLEMTYYVFDDIFDFESGPGPLLASGGSTGNPPGFNGDWEWGVPYGGTYGPSTAYSPTNCWGMVLDGAISTPGYSDTCWSIIDFQLNVGTGNDAVFGYYEWNGLGTSYYDSAFVIANGDTLLVFNGSNEEWHYVSLDLSAYTGVVDMRFYEKKTRSGVSYDGWYFDDFTFINCELVAPEIDVTPLVIESSVDPLEADTVDVTISNLGVGTLFYNVSVNQDPMTSAGNGSNLPSPLSNSSSAEPLGYRPVELKDANPQADVLYRQEIAASGIKVDGSERYTVYEPYYPPVIDAFGGPDDYGYTWIDSDEPSGPAYGWIDISTIGTEITAWTGSVDDGYTSLIPMGTAFDFYGGSYDSIVVSTNGWASLSAQTNSYLSNATIPSSGLPNNLLAVLWGDHDGGTVGHCYYYYDAIENQFIVSWVGWPFYPDPTDPHDFQIILDADDGTILYQYGTGVYHTSETIGIENEDGSDGLQVAYNAAYARDSLAVLFVPPIFWLQSNVSSGSIPPAGGPDLVEITLSALELPVGIYTGGVEITSNDPDEALIDIPVTFIVGGLGTVAGQVTDANTAGTLEGAIVTATWVSATTVVDTTDEGGNYSIDITPGTVNVTVEMPGYATDSQNVVVVADQTTTHNVALGAPIVFMDASPVIDTVTVGDTELYGRYIYNNGTAPLIYDVTLNFEVDAPLSIRSNMVSERIASVVDPDGNADAAPYRYNSGNLPIITAFQDSVACIILDTLTDTQFLGIEFDGTYFWITGGNSGGEPNKLYKYDATGVLVSTYDQSSAAGWGWRDLAWDGDYLYASDSYNVVQIDPATGLATGVTIAGPSNPARALAYDPDTDHFWTASFSSSIWEFGRDGTVHNTFANSKAIYGMAWDDLSEDGPWLWVFSQDGPGVDTLMEISQFDPDSGVYTGVSFQGAIPDGYVGSISGGACFTTEFDPSVGALFVLGQGDPTDFIYGYEITENITWLAVQSGGSGEVAVDDSALIEFLVDFDDTTIVVDSTYEADANINTNDPYPPEWNPSIHFAITSELGGCAYVCGDVNGSDSYNGLDITYGVAFFKGGPDPMCPYGSCPIPPCDAFFYCGDVNASCSYNGLDITYGVAYFKGGPGPLPCPSCPPIGGPATIGNELRPTEQPAFESKSKSKKGSSLKR